MANTFKNATDDLTNTSQRTLYTCPSATTAIVHNLTIANTDGTNDCDVTIEVTDTSASVTRKLAYLITVPAKNSLIWDKPINLEATDVLKLTAATASRLQAFASILEIT